MSKEKENQTDNKAFTEECNAVLRAVSDAQYVIGGKWKIDDYYFNGERK